MYDHSFRLDSTNQPPQLTMNDILAALTQATRSGNTRIVLADEAGEDFFAFQSWRWGWYAKEVTEIVSLAAYIRCDEPAGGAYGWL